MTFHKPLNINFIGNFDQGYVGETADENHLVRELRKGGQEVQECPRDIWKAFVDGERNKDWSSKIPKKNYDINIICKWHHFNDGKYIRALRARTDAPVFYWVWDFMDYGDGFHKSMARAANLYLGNDWVGRAKEENYYYFPFDVCDGEIPRFHSSEKKHDVVFFGSFLDQGVRKEHLLEISKHCNLKIYSWNYKDWQKLGLNASPAVWGNDFAKKVSESKICLQFSVDDNTWGYWSNRTGKILTQGGFLLAHYAPGMELFLRDGAEYFSTTDEAVSKIHYYLDEKNSSEYNEIIKRSRSIGERFTSRSRIKELIILMQRYKEKNI